MSGYNRGYSDTIKYAKQTLYVVDDKNDHL